MHYCYFVCGAFLAVAFVCFAVAKLWLLATGKGFRLCRGDKGGAAPLDPLQPLEKAGETFILAGETFIFGRSFLAHLLMIYNPLFPIHKLLEASRASSPTCLSLSPPTDVSQTPCPPVPTP